MKRAWARTELSDNFAPFLRNTFDLGLNHEDAVELYYSASVTPWLTVSPSLQAIRSGLNKALDSVPGRYLPIRVTAPNLILTMNEKLEALIKAEIGVDDGHELPNIPFVNWAIDKVS